MCLWGPRPAAADITFIPLPAFDTDPNAGNTYGVLPVVLFKDEADRVKGIFAPSLTFNEFRGVTGTVRGMADGHGLTPEQQQIIVNGVVLPFVLVFMLLLTNDRELMGEHANSRGFNIVAWSTVVAMIVLTALATITRR